MLVSIITVAYNAQDTIARTIESVLHQTYPDVEYIIIDGASTDDTVKIAESYGVRVISEPDRGMYDALNKGANLVSGELVGQINADDWYEPDAVENMVKLYEAEHYDAAWGSLNVITPSGSFVKHAKLSKLWTTTHWCHPAMFSRREILLQFPYALESMYDDFDYITAVHRAGKKIVTTDKVISNFTFGGQSTKKSLKEAKRRVDVTYSIYKKYGMSRLYYLHRWLIELAKVIVG